MPLIMTGRVSVEPWCSNGTIVALRAGGAGPVPTRRIRVCRVFLIYFLLRWKHVDVSSKKSLLG